MKQTEMSQAAHRDPWGDNVESLSRDGARTPMQWTPGPNAGFSDSAGRPWLPVSADSATLNVESEIEDRHSILNMYRRLLELRRDSSALRVGSYVSHPASNELILAYRRESDYETVSVALNLSSDYQEVALGSGNVVFSTYHPDRDEPCRHTLKLAPLEGVILSHP